MSVAPSPAANPLPPTQLRAARKRSTATLVTGVALGSTGHIAAVTVATIVASQMLGTNLWAGAPGATVVLGAAIGAVLLSSFMAKRGRRLGLALGYGIGVIGALIATAAVIAGSFPLLLGGTLLIGFGNTSNQLSRYANADMAPVARRAAAISLVVWAATVGSVIGPQLVPISSNLAANAGLPPLAGPYLVPVLFVGLAAILSFALLRPDPYVLAEREAVEQTSVRPSLSTPVWQVLRRPTVLAAWVSLIVGQFVMVLIMTMTPLHMTEHGSDLAAVGLVLSAHTFGMFALSPISGRLTDRFGSVPVILAGSSLLAVASIMAAVAPPEGGVMLFAALFLLGYGWNLGFVAGSAMLSRSLEIHERTRVQGVADAMIWSSAAAASLGSGFVMVIVGYTALGVLGACAVLIPVIVLRSQRRAIRAAAVPAPVPAP